MDTKTIVELKWGDLEAFAVKVAQIAIEKFKSEQIEDKLLSQAAAKKILRIGDPRLKELILTKKLKTTNNGKIHYNSLNKYLKGETE
jgi:hypothetical protein